MVRAKVRVFRLAFSTVLLKYSLAWSAELRLLLQNSYSMSATIDQIFQIITKVLIIYFSNNNNIHIITGPRCV